MHPLNIRSAGSRIMETMRIYLPKRAHPLAAAMVIAVMGAPAQADPRSTGDTAKKAYPWPRRASSYEPLEARIPPPEGFNRVKAAPGSYTAWLRRLPLLPEGSAVKSYKGKVILEANDSRLAAVVDLDLSNRDRQQCADTIMRLRGEYHYSRGRADMIRLRWTGSKRYRYTQWRQGIRPVKVGKRFKGFSKSARSCRGHRCLRRYLEFMFSWTGTMHLMRENKVRAADVAAGDFFIQGGSPGHTVVILDLARNAKGELRALIGQGFMPAQDLHVMRGAGGSPWFKLDPKGEGVRTPFWHMFGWKDLRRFKW